MLLEPHSTLSECSALLLSPMGKLIVVQTHTSGLFLLPYLCCQIVDISSFYFCKSFYLQGGFNRKCFVVLRGAPSLCCLTWPWPWPVNSPQPFSMLPGRFLQDLSFQIFQDKKTTEIIPPSLWNVQKTRVWSPMSRNPQVVSACRALFADLGV